MSGSPRRAPAAPGLSPLPATQPPKGGKGRKRGENVRQRFFSFRLTTKEHAALLRAAGDVPLGAYVRSKVLEKLLPDYRSRGIGATLSSIPPIRPSLA
jgi:hypothetical protein